MVEAISVTNLRVATIAALILSAACSPTSTARKSDAKDLAADPHAKNIALLFGAPNDLEGVQTDINGLTRLFSKPELGFQVIVKNRATSRDFLTASVEAAKSLDENSTLFWYYSGHGLESGALFSQDQRLVYFSSILKAMNDARTTPFKRLIVVMDSCFSGQNVDGQQAIIPSSTRNGYATSMANLVKSDFEVSSKGTYGRPFQEAIVIAAARKNQTSDDAGAQIGGIFTASWRAVLEQQLRDPSKTIRNMADATVKATFNNSQGDHTPVYRASPESILDEPLMGGKPQPAAFDAYFLLGGSDLDQPFVVASVPSTLGVSSAAMCRGDVAACRATDAKVIAVFRGLENSKIAGRTLLQTSTALKMTELVGTHSQMLTTIFRDSQGVEKGFRSIRIAGRGQPASP